MGREALKIFSNLGELVDAYPPIPCATNPLEVYNRVYFIGNMTKYEAVIFDLGGTLTYPFYWSEYAEVRREIASVLSAPDGEVMRIWRDEGYQLMTGIIRTYPDFIRYICTQLGLEVEDGWIDTAVDIAFEMTRRKIMMPRDGAIEVLTYLKANGYKIGLISDCGPDVPALWNDTPFAPFFDVTVFSCSVGLEKTDTRIFELAVEKMDVRSEKCVYVADGMRKELSCAAELGMRALQIRVSGETNENPLNEDWNGSVISSLIEVMTLLS